MEINKHVTAIKSLRSAIANIEFLENRIKFLESEGAEHADDLIAARGQLVKEIEHYIELKDKFCKLEMV